MLRRRLLPLLLLALAGAGGWFWYTRPVEVVLAPASRGPAVEAVYATGSVEPVHWARVGPALRARLTAVLAEEGERVREGQPLARLDDRQARALAEEAEARARFAVEDLARTRALVARDITARASLERAERDARAARATAEMATHRLDDYVVRAPADGLVLRRDAEVGEVVDTPAALFWIGEPRPLRVTAEVDEEDIARIRPGQRAFLRADAFAGQALEAEVAQITPKGDTTRKAYRVRLALPEDTPLLIGMTVEANIVLRETDRALLVPAGAVALAAGSGAGPGGSPGGSPAGSPTGSPTGSPAGSPAAGAARAGHVWVLSEGRLARRPVLVGVQGARAFEILDGLAEGEAVVAEARAGLREGQPARARP